MTDLSRPAQLTIAIEFLEYLETGEPMTRRTAYSSADLRAIQRLWRGEGER